MEKWPIGVFASIDAGLGVSLDVAQQLGVPTVQLHAPRKPKRTLDSAQALRHRCEEAGIVVTAIFGGFEGESYADITTAARTVGLVPTETRDARLQEMKNIVDFAQAVGVDVVALHIGFVPHDRSNPAHAEIVAVAQDLCDHCKQNRQSLHLETGQETAETLLQFISDVGRDNLFINFDPANMIAYGIGEPMEALRKLGHLVRSVHCKDAKWAARPGQEWGAEVPLGEGDVNIELYLQTLDEIGYTGPLTIEREIPHDPQRQQADIAAAVTLLEKLKAKIG